MLLPSHKTLTEDPCPRCLRLIGLPAAYGEEENFHRLASIDLEALQRLPEGAAMAALAHDGSGKCCDDCAAADSMVARGAVDRRLSWMQARVAVANDRREQYRAPGLGMGLVASGHMRPSAPGDFERQLAWLDELKPSRLREEQAKASLGKPPHAVGHHWLKGFLGLDYLDRLVERGPDGGWFQQLAHGVETEYRAETRKQNEALTEALSTTEQHANKGVRGDEMITIGTVNHPTEGALTVMYGRFAEDPSCIALLLICPNGAPYSKPAIFIDAGGITQALEGGEFVLHHDTPEDIKRAMLNDSGGLFVDTEKRVDYGFIVGQPVYKLRYWTDHAEQWWDARRAAEGAPVSP